MKKFCALLIALFVGVMALQSPAQADPASCWGLTTPFTCTIDDGKVTITGHSEPVPADLVIPTAIDGLPVTAIGHSAFHGKRLENLTIPGTVTTIDDRAFAFTQLRTLTLPDSVTSIGFGAFRYNELTAVTLPNALAVLGPDAFAMNELTTLTLPNTLTTISDGAFASNELTSVTLPNALTSIGAAAFKLNKLTAITLPETLTSIGDDAFAYSNLTTLTLPHAVTSIGSSAFHGNPIATLRLSDSLTTVYEYAFFDNRLINITVPSSVYFVGDDAFNSPTLTSVRLTGAAPGGAMRPFGNSDVTVRYPRRHSAGYYGFPWSSYVTQPFAYVSFNTSAADTAAPPVQMVDVNTAAEQPADPTKAGFDFAGWYAAGLDRAHLFSSPITDDVELTAQFVQPAVPVLLTGPATASGTVGEAFTWTPSSVEGYPEPRIEVSSGSLPDGLSLNAATGVISGTPTTAGSYPIRLYAHNGIHSPSFVDITLTIAAAPLVAPPVIAPTAITGVAPKIRGTAREGKTLTAGAGAVKPSAARVAYRWKADGKTIKGATKKTLKLRKGQAGRKITVTVTATAPGLKQVTKKSRSTLRVSSAKRRILVSDKTVAKGQKVTVTATGFKPGQKLTIWLGGKAAKRTTADAYGTVRKNVRFASSVDPGTRRVRVSGYDKNNKFTKTVLTRVRYR